MSENQKARDDTRPSALPDGRPPRKPYKPPVVVSHSALEVITGACSPAPPGKPDYASCTLAKS